MSTVRKIALAAMAMLVILVRCSYGASASTTTLSGPMPPEALQVQLPSFTGSSGDQLYIDREAMKVTAVSSGGQLTVQRGVDGTRTAGHAAGTTVYYGRAKLFTTQPPALGTCDVAQFPDTIIDVRNGQTWQCKSGAWFQTLPGPLNITDLTIASFKTPNTLISSDAAGKLFENVNLTFASGVLNFKGTTVKIRSSTSGTNLQLEAYNGKVVVNSRFGFASVAAYSCDNTKRGEINVIFGATGVKDIVQVCTKDAANLYNWRTIY